MPSAADAPWAEVGRRIQERIDGLQLTQAEVLRRSGISYKTLAGYLSGKPIRRRDKERGLCEALGWSHDSIERIKNGEEPVVVGKASTRWGDPESLTERLDRLEAEMDERVSRLEAEMEAINAAVAKELDEPIELPITVRQAVDHLMGLEALPEETKRNLRRLSKAHPPEENEATG